MSLKLNGSSAGSVSFDAPSDTSPSGTDVTLTLPTSAGSADQVLVTNGSGTLSWESRMTAAGPAFSAYANASQTVSTTTFTKLAINTEEFDTNSNYDSATNYRFTPTVEGYYQVSARVAVKTTGTISRSILTFYKNGVETPRMYDLTLSGTTGRSINISRLFYMNGTTDYLEVYTWVQSTGTITVGGTAVDDRNTFDGVLVRPA